MGQNVRITIDPAIAHGKPVVAGTRTPVTVVLDHLATGDSVDLICHEYDLTPEDVRACLTFASTEITRMTFATLRPTGS